MTVERQDEFVITTEGRGTLDITRKIAKCVADAGVDAGLCHVFVQHTSASLMLCENADPDVQVDMETIFSRLVPDGDRAYIHRAEGPDDMAAHARSVMTTNDITIPIRNRRLALGTWQGLYLWEHRAFGHRRRILVTIMS